MSTRSFRFGVVAALAPTADAWVGTARRAEDLGFTNLLVPDTLGTLSPLPALAAAATATKTLRVGPFVLNAPLYSPAAIAHDTVSLDVLTGGRFELGLGAGRPGGERDAERLGVPFGTPGERVRHLAETIRVVKAALDSRDDEPGAELRAVQQPGPPILVAGAGRRLLTLAAREADIVALGVPPTGTEFDLAAKVGELRDVAGDRFDSLELSVNLAGVGNEPPAWVAKALGADPAELIRRGSAAILTGTPAEMADTLQRRRDALGISYVSVNGMFMEQFAPVVERLAGR